MLFPPVRQHSLLITTTLLVTMLLASLAPTFTNATLTAPVRASTSSDQPWIDAAPNTLLLKLRPGTSLSGPSAGIAAQSTSSSDPSLSRLLGQLGTTNLEPLFAPPVR